MPFIPHTPESFLPRSDSKNPAATCRGLTSTGRPCRRAIASSPRSSESIAPSLTSNNAYGPETYCWQHKDQATAPIERNRVPQGLQNTTVKERSSIDTLVDRLGILELENHGARRKKSRKHVPEVDGELPHLVVADDSNQRKEHRRTEAHHPRPPKQQSNLDLFCCIGVAGDAAPPRPARTQPRMNKPVTAQRTSTLPPMMKVRQDSARLSVASPGILPAGAYKRPSISRDPPSRTAEYLSLIPPSASPQTTSLLLAELAKPVSTFDEEGFIYMFWLTSETLPSTPPSEAATSLLMPPNDLPRSLAGHRRTSDVLKSFSSDPSPNASKTILLKIGRASNVHRRLNEWTRQCGYNLSLIRYYPYHTSSPSTSPSRSSRSPSTAHKVPHAHRVERLIHLELARKRAKGSGKCGSCGKEHREWFEVQASRLGLKEIDEVIRRWVDWDVKHVS